MRWASLTPGCDGVEVVRGEYPVRNAEGGERDVVALLVSCAVVAKCERRILILVTRPDLTVDPVAISSRRILVIAAAPNGVSTVGTRVAETAEWSKAAVLKTAVPQGTRGSNPVSSAEIIGEGSRCPRAPALRH